MRVGAATPTNFFLLARRKGERRRRGGAGVSAHQVRKTTYLEWASVSPASSAALLAFMEMALSIRALDAHMPVPPKTGNVSSGRRWRSWQRWVAFHRRLCEGMTHAVFVALRYLSPSLSNSSLAALLGQRRRAFVLPSSPFDTAALGGPKASSRRRSTTQAAVTMSGSRIRWRCARRVRLVVKMV
ncbi:hypothetical protein B0H14DRAFT_1648325 [Mycena olivaceomarginata]|nr:hypothetical protein B0H14DRAFT_1648325 [Mycena olivaceomarginata]